MRSFVADRQASQECQHWNTGRIKGGSRFSAMPQPIKELVIGPVAANLSELPIRKSSRKRGVRLTARVVGVLELVPELYPILRHAPIRRILLNVISPTRSPVSSNDQTRWPRIRCRVEIVLTPHLTDAAASRQGGQVD